MRKVILGIVTAASLMCGCSQTTASDQEPAHISVQILDKSGPVITASDKTVEEGDEVALKECYTIEDNVDEALEGRVSCTKGSAEIKDGKVKFEKAGEYIFEVKATDKSGNESSFSFKVTVTAKPEPTPEPTPEATPEPKESGTAASNPSSSGAQPAQSQPVQQPVQQPAAEEQPVQSQPSSQEAVTKYFMFSDGYNMQTAGPACKAEFGSYGSGTKSCDPIVGDDGLYKGYVFHYIP